MTLGFSRALFAFVHENVHVHVHVHEGLLRANTFLNSLPTMERPRP